MLKIVVDARVSQTNPVYFFPEMTLVDIGVFEFTNQIQ